MPFYPATPGWQLHTITTFDYFSVGVEDRAITSDPSSATWVAANRAILVPVYIPDWGTVVKLFMANGTVVSGNIDMGLYDESFNRLVSIGSTAQSGTSDLQVFDITDTTIGPGRYYLAGVLDNVTGTVMRNGSSLYGQRASGLCEMGSAFALPTTNTPGSMSNAFLPLMGLTYRTTV